MRNPSRHLAVASIVTSLFTTGIAAAQQAPDQTQQTQPAPQVQQPPPPQNAPPPPPPPGSRDGVRFRGGIAVAGGGEFISDFAVGMGGLEGRLGVQINNLIGVYAQPSLAFGAGKVGSSTGFTGTAGVSGLIDFTFVNHVFAGVGGGVGVLNNPVGPELHFRVGGYPLMGYGENGITRKGLMIGADARFFFLSSGAQSLTVMQLLASIGYEAF